VIDIPKPNLTSQVVPWIYWGVFQLSRLVFGLYFSRIVIQGAENLPTEGPVVLAAKHFSRWDPPIVALLSHHEPLRFMTNANQFSGLQGWVISRMGAFPVDLDQPQLSSLRHTVQLLQAGHKLVLFPEGGIVRDRPLRDLKPGLARLVLQAEATAPQPVQIPIVPIAIHYQPTAQFQAKVILQVCPPLYSQDYQQGHAKQTAQTLTAGLQAALLKGLAQISASQFNSSLPEKS
jgi:1-acyl-sn-glycerol-3-phosphate acyltransferase